MDRFQLIFHFYIDQLLSLLGWSIFSSIVVSISACHHHRQLAGDRGSIPRWREYFLFAVFASHCIAAGGRGRGRGVGGTLSRGTRFWRAVSCFLLAV